MAFSEDLSSFFVDFCVTVTVGGVSVRGIFDNAFIQALGISGTGPVLIVKTASVPSVAQGDAVVISEVNYTVAEIKPDGSGITVLELDAA